MKHFTAKLGEFRAVRRPNWLRRGLVAAFAVVVFAGYASLARADCGDWLANPAQPMGAHHAGQNGANHSDGVIPGPKPCNGPMCQKTPTAPLAPVPATGLERVDKLGLAFDSLLGDPLFGQSSLQPESDVHPSKGFLPRIEHPPRA